MTIYYASKLKLFSGPAKVCNILLIIRSVRTATLFRPNSSSPTGTEDPEHALGHTPGQQYPLDQRILSAARTSSSSRKIARAAK